MRVSVVICTYNRADGLRATLESLATAAVPRFRGGRRQRPVDRSHGGDARASTDVRSRLVDNPLANLSVSRNFGIRAAAGELVAFIDDDALPEPAWLEQVVAAVRGP